jgi:hypothetical protein
VLYLEKIQNVFGIEKNAESRGGATAPVFSAICL